MQFVRRQRLSAAMEKLQTADLDDTVTTIARDTGYRYTSNFTNDFQREFGVKPSVVLRSSRSGKGNRV
jgi:AraC-like DNA-binding protein